MPYEFNYTLRKERGNINKSFKCYLKHSRCEHVHNGRRCKRVLVIGLPYCWQHLSSISHLKVKNVPAKGGKGLFAHWPGHVGPVFQKGDTICQYFGDMLSPDQRAERYHIEGISPYGVQPGMRPRNDTQNEYNQTTAIDSSCIRSIGSLINTPNENERSNAKFGGYPLNSNRLNINCVRSINHGDEILIGYGGGYWQKNKFIQHSTNAVSNTYKLRNPIR